MNWAKLGPKLYSSFTSLNNGGQNERERLCKTYLETVCIAQQNAETLNPQIKLLHSMSSMATSLLKTPLNVFHKTPQSLCMLPLALVHRLIFCIDPQIIFTKFISQRMWVGVCNCSKNATNSSNLQLRFSVSI